MRYIQDRPAYNHLGYSQDSNLTNPNPNPHPNLNPLTLLETVVRIRTNETHHSRKSPCTLIPKINNNFRWSVMDLHCPANSQNWQIVQDGPANNQCDCTRS